MNRRARIFALPMLLALTLTSCDYLLGLLGGDEETALSIVERIDAFELDLDEDDRSALAATHFHPDMQNYSQLAEDLTLTTSPLSYDNAPFSIGFPTVSTVSTVSGEEIATCTFENTHGAEGTIVFTMELSGSDYRVRKLVLTLHANTEVEYVLQAVSGR